MRTNKYTGENMKIPDYETELVKKGNSYYVIVPAYIPKFLKKRAGEKFKVQLALKDGDSVLWFSTTDPRPAGVV